MNYRDIEKLSSSFVSSKGMPEPVRRIFLKNYRAQMSIGIHPHEKAKRQLVIINVDLYFDATIPSQGDQIESVVDYDFVRTEIQRISQERHFNLQETLCEEILGICLAKPGVLAARISTEKPEAYADCDAVGYELFWRKDLPRP
jgi:7,8-dihydroneopterin aldolase/epimerase/oxygenase